MKKKAMGRKMRELLLFAERLLIVLLAVSAAFTYSHSVFSVSASYGITYHEEEDVLSLSALTEALAGREEAFEEKDIFTSLLKSHMERITRYVALRHQLETDGAYDGGKVIDIAEYANRLTQPAVDGVTARFYLDDLIKWGNYGFTYTKVIGTWEELNQLFAGNEPSYTSGGLNTEGMYREQAENALDLGLEPAEDDRYVMEILVSRYQTTTGKELMSCASSVEEYERLKADLISSAESLFANYSEYTGFSEEYKTGAVNIGYCFRVGTDNSYAWYTNGEEPAVGVDEFTTGIKEQGGKFIYFNPDKVQINTNTEITARELRTMLKEYEYTFSDNTRVWFWVDTDYPAADDFRLTKELFGQAEDYRRLGLILVAASGAAVLLLLVYLTIKEGRALTGEGSLTWKMAKRDKAWLELWVFPLGVMAAALINLGSSWMSYSDGQFSGSRFLIFCGLCAFLANECGIRFYFSLIRRIKARGLWRTTLLRYLLVKGKGFVRQMRDNPNLAVRIWIPYLIFLMINLIMVLLGVGGVIGALILDVLVGIRLYRDNQEREDILQGIEQIRDGKVRHRIDTDRLVGDNLRLAESVNSIGSGLHRAVETSMKDEKLKTDLLTNVSHDIKTPLTSIITYVDLLKREDIKEEKIRSYLAVLDNKSQRLKQLIDDLVEASKLSSGNLALHPQVIDFAELVRQALGEFCEKFAEKRLQVVSRLPGHTLCVEADSSQLWRVLENLLQNVSKYALEGTRVYVELEESARGKEEWVVFSIKNISAGFLEAEADELTERFIRGDQSRRTEGSGLGLSIAKNLIEVQQGEFEVQTDGDLFKVIIGFPRA